MFAMNFFELCGLQLTSYFVFERFIAFGSAELRSAFVFERWGQRFTDYVTVSRDIGDKGKSGAEFRAQKTLCVKNRFSGMRSRSIMMSYFGMIELFAGLALIIVALIPMALSFHKESETLRGLYYRSVAEQVLDGQREILAAGEWRKYPFGESELRIDNPAFANLPDGNVIMKLSKRSDDRVAMSLRWKPTKFPGVGVIEKEAVFHD